VFNTRAVRENADNKLDGNLGQIAVDLRRMFSSLAGMPLSGLSWNQALRSGRIEVHGDRRVAAQLPKWNLHESTTMTPA
jgi:hypothetical protein